MFSRRQLRIKVMHVLYAYRQKSITTIALSEKYLLGNLRAAPKLYFYNLYFLTRLAEYIANIAAPLTSLNKTQANTDKSLLLNNDFIRHLINDTSFTARVGEENLESYINTDIIRTISNELKKTEPYTNYLKGQDKRDRNILLYIFKNIMLNNDNYNQHLQEININWYVDRETVKEWLIRVIKSEELISDFFDSKQKEDRVFSIGLLKKTIQHTKEYQPMIAGKAKNWDPDRITIIDNTLMQMALSEILYMPTIPVKVTIDEYVEISKKYSTPKSKEFINGLLDKLMHDLKDAGRIKKTGRGTQE